MLEGPKEKFVYVVNAESKVEPRPVQVGEWTGDGWIIESGLQPGERVVLDGVMKIGPGAPVQVVSSQAAAEQGGGPQATSSAAAKGPDKAAGKAPTAQVGAAK